MRKIDQNDFVGITKIHDIDVSIKFSDYTLLLYLPEDLARELLMDKTSEGGWILTGNKSLEFDNLECYTMDGKYILHLMFDKDRYSSSNAIFGNTTLKIFVYRYFIYSIQPENSIEKNMITFYSKQFHRFLNMIPSIDITPIQNKSASGTIKFKFDCVNQESVFSVNDNNFKIVPNYKLMWNGPEFEFIPGISLKFEKKLDKEEISKLYDTMNSILYFAFMRTNIYPEIVEYQNGDEIGEIRNYIGDCFNEGKEETTAIWRDSISWHILYLHLDQLFINIYNNEIHLLHIPKRKIERICIDFNSISKDAAAFEHEFDTVYPEGIPYSEERKNIEEEIVCELTSLMDRATSKKKKIYKGFINHVHIESLSDKIEYALGIYDGCINHIKNKFAKNLSNESIAEICSGIRNDVDHGNKVNELSDDMVDGFIVLRALIYAIQLRKLGYSDDEINISTRLLYQLNGFQL